jgi:hypothetical protein
MSFGTAPMCLDKRKRTGLAIAILSLLPLACKSSGNASALRSSELARSSVRDQLDITAPIDSLIYTRNRNIFDPDDQEFKAEWLPATFKLNNGPALPGKVRLRGNSRFCDSFPQLSIKLDKGGKIYKSRSFKMVTHGQFELDPKRKFEGVECEDQPLFQNDPEKAVDEQRIYDLAKILLTEHMRSYPLTINYEDPTAHLSVADTFGFLLEDTDDLAERYHGKKKTFTLSETAESWTSENQEYFELAAVRVAVLNYQIEQYRQIEKESPNLSKADISQRVKALGVEAWPRFEADQVNLGRAFKPKLEATQKAYIARFDHQSFTEAMLFNMLIRNVDWGLFGLSPTNPEGAKNLAFFEDDQQKIHIIPYDFDMAEIMKPGNPMTRSYDDRFQLFQSNLAKNFPEFPLSDLKPRMKRWAERLDRALEDGSIQSLGFDDSVITHFKQFRDFLLKM